MALCPLARSIVLSSGGALSYTTPPTVEKLRERHDEFVEVAREAIASSLRAHHLSYLELRPENGCLTLRLDRDYAVCGRPDMVYLVYGEGVGPVVLVCEITLSPSVEHMVRGELLFYIIEHHVRYGTDVVGLLVGTRLIELAVPGSGEGVSALLRRLFTKPDHHRAIRKAESERVGRPWMCSLCDLKHLCPLGGEV